MLSNPESDAASCEPEGQEWRPGALCRDEDPDLFYSDKTTDQRRAKATCLGCAARKACLNDAITMQRPDGIWGGMTHTERQLYVRYRDDLAQVDSGALGSLSAMTKAMMMGRVRRMIDVGLRVEAGTPPENSWARSFIAFWGVTGLILSECPSEATARYIEVARHYMKGSTINETATLYEPYKSGTIHKILSQVFHRIESLGITDTEWKTLFVNAIDGRSHAADIDKIRERIRQLPQWPKVFAQTI